MNKNAPIGIFDSGLGGLTVAAAVKELLPNEDIIYLGDTARVPYGDKSAETVLRFGCENAHFLVEKNVKLIIVACNTVSSLAIDGIRKHFKSQNIEIPLIGVLEAGVDTILKSNVSDIAVIGTRATINSGAYRTELLKNSKELSIRSVACPLFAPIVEEGLADHEIAESAFKLYLNELKATPPEALLLGCTHYPLLIKSLQKFLPRSVNIIDSAHAVAKFADKYLDSNKLKSEFTNEGTEEFYVTDSPETFINQAEKFLGRKVRDVRKSLIDGTVK